MSEIVNPQQETYWIITNGSDYATGITGVGQTTTIGNGWSLWWTGTDQAEYMGKCQEVGIDSALPSPD